MLNIDEKKFVEELKKHFATKQDLEKFATKKDLETFATKADLETFSTKKDLNDFKVEMYEFKKDTKAEFHELRTEMREGFKTMEENFKQINEKLGELKSSANALDKILEQHPIQRIERLESHAHLSPFTPTVEEE